MQIERSGSERLFQRIDQEFAQQHPRGRCDHHLGCIAHHHLEAGTASWRRSYRKIWPGIFPPSIATPTACPPPSRIYLSSIAYNTNLVKAEDAPKSFADLLDPKWAGKMVKVTPPIAAPS